MSEEANPDSSVVCPFCGEGDFDLIGLKAHIAQGDCEPYNELPLEARMRWL